MSPFLLQQASTAAGQDKLQESLARVHPPPFLTICSPV